jgi:hypothetical protein
LAVPLEGLALRRQTGRGMRSVILRDIINWLTDSPLGVAALIAGLIIAFIGIAALSELRTRRMYPDKSKKKAKRPGR